MPIPKFCDDFVFVIYSYNFATLVLPLFGPECMIPYAGTLEAPTPSTTVQLQQQGSELALSWDACQSKVVVDRYVAWWQCS